METAPELELLAPVPLNVVNFCYRAEGLDAAALNGLNARILVALQERGIAAPSSTLLQGRFAIRVAITNHRSRREDFDALVAATVTLGGGSSPRNRSRGSTVRGLNEETCPYPHWS